MGSARRDDDAFPSERIRGAEFADDGVGDLRDLGQAPFINVAACEVSPTGPYDANAARAYRADILLRRGGFPHIHIHRGRNDDGPRCSEKRCRHEVGPMNCVACSDMSTLTRAPSFWRMRTSSHAL